MFQAVLVNSATRPSKTPIPLVCKVCEYTGAPTITNMVAGRRMRCWCTWAPWTGVQGQQRFCGIIRERGLVFADADLGTDAQLWQATVTSAIVKIRLKCLAPGCGVESSSSLKHIVAGHGIACRCTGGKTESRLLQRLQGEYDGRFVGQHPAVQGLKEGGVSHCDIGSVDTNRARIVVECDGSQHMRPDGFWNLIRKDPAAAFAFQVEMDLKKDTVLIARGYFVLRIAQTAATTKAGWAWLMAVINLIDTGKAGKPAVLCFPAAAYAEDFAAFRAKSGFSISKVGYPGIGHGLVLRLEAPAATTEKAEEEEAQPYCGPDTTADDKENAEKGQPAAKKPKPPPPPPAAAPPPKPTAVKQSLLTAFFTAQK